jgi:hypothetical protein
MKSAALFSVLLTGCGVTPGSLVIVGHSTSTETTSTSPSTETTVTSTQTTGTTNTTTTGTTVTGTQTTSTTGTITTASELSWTGERLIDIPSAGCEEYIYEDGVEVTEDSIGADLLAACDECTRVWEIQASPEYVCGYSVTPVVYRGLDFHSDGTATIYSLSDEGSYWDASYYSNGDLDLDGILEYEYDGDWYIAYGVVELSPVW